MRLRTLQITKEQARFQTRKLREDLNVRKDFHLKESKRLEKSPVFEAKETEEEWRVFDEVLNTTEERKITKIQSKRSRNG